MVQANRNDRLRRRTLSSSIFLLLLIVLPVVLTGANLLSIAAAQAEDFPSTAPHPKTLIQQIAEQNKTVPETPVDNAGVQVGYINGAVPPPPENPNKPEIDPNASDWKKFWADVVRGFNNASLGAKIAEQILGIIQYISEKVAPYLAELIIWVLNQATYNVNIAAGQPKAIADLVKPVTDTMRAMAFDLLLLLFVLSIWKYWTEGATKGGSNLMGAVGRLIATALLIMSWSTISDYIIQISNDMISQILFTGKDAGLIETAMRKLVNIGLTGLAGTILVYFLGGITFFLLLSILLIQAVYLLVLKSVQTALMIAQYMFAPIFLVFFASTSTERIATTFIRSCVEISLWSFVWIGFVRILIIILGSNWNIYGQIITVIGMLELMLSVPGFMAKAQISPVSELIAGAVAFRMGSKMAEGVGKRFGLTKSSGLLSKGYDALFGQKDKTQSGLDGMSSATQSQLNTLRNAANGGNGGTPPFTGPGGGNPPPTPGTPPPGTTSATVSAGLPGGRTVSATTGQPRSTGATGSGSTAGTPGTGSPTAGAPLTAGQGPANATPPRRLRTPIGNAQGLTQQANGDVLNKAVGDLFDKYNKGKLAFGTSDSDQTEFLHDGLNGVTAINFGRNATEEDKAKAIIQAALANRAMTNANGRRAAEAAAGHWLGQPDPANADKPTMQKWNNAVNNACIKGAQQYMSGQRGNEVSQLLGATNGAYSADQEAAAIHALTDDTLAHSPFNPNYKKTKEAVEQAELPVNAATMAMAASPEGSRLRGQALNAGYNALAGTLGRSLAAAGHTPGTTGYTAALGQAITNSTPERQRAAAAVGVGFLNTGEADGFTQDDWEVWVNKTENEARNQGMRPDAVVSGLRGMMNTPAARKDASAGAGTADRLNKATQAFSAMREERAPVAAFASESFAGYMYDLAGRNELTPQRVKGALSAAKVGGFNQPEMVLAIDQLDSAILEQPDISTIISRAVEISTPANIAGNIKTMEYMVRECGYSAKNINAADITRSQTISAVKVGGQDVVPRMSFVMKLVRSGVEFNNNNIAIASLAPVAGLKENETGPAIEAVAAYLDAPAPAGGKMYQDVNALKQDDVFINTLIGIGKIHGPQQCGMGPGPRPRNNVGYVEQTYQDNLQPAQNQNDFRINVNGRTIRVPAGTKRRQYEEDEHSFQYEDEQRRQEEEEEQRRQEEEEEY